MCMPEHRRKSWIEDILNPEEDWWCIVSLMSKLFGFYVLWIRVVLFTFILCFRRAEYEGLCYLWTWDVCMVCAILCDRFGFWIYWFLGVYYGDGWIRYLCYHYILCNVLVLFYFIFLSYYNLWLMLLVELFDRVLFPMLMVSSLCSITCWGVDC